MTKILKRKFKATDAEMQRPAMTELSQSFAESDLTEKEILAGLAKMKAGKACGPDDTYTH